jgi:hypothetical protein
MIDRGDTNAEYIESAYGASSTSELSEEERKPYGRNCNKDKQSKSRGQIREDQEEGRQQCASKEHLPPLQNNSTQEAPSCQPGQMHVEQEIQEIPLQIHLQQY